MSMLSISLRWYLTQLQSFPYDDDKVEEWSDGARRLAAILIGKGC